MRNVNERDKRNRALNFFGKVAAGIIFFILTMFISNALGVPPVVGFILACVLAVVVAILIASVFVAADKSGEKAFRQGTGDAAWLRKKCDRIMYVECVPIEDQLNGEKQDLPSRFYNLTNWLGTPDAEYREQSSHFFDWNEAISALRATIPEKHPQLIPQLEKVASSRKSLYTAMSEWREALPKIGKIIKRKSSCGAQARFEILESYSTALAKLESDSAERDAFEIAAKTLFDRVQEKVQEYRGSWDELIIQYDQQIKGNNSLKDIKQSPEP